MHLYLTNFFCQLIIMKLYRVNPGLVSKLPSGKIIKYINKQDTLLEPKTGIVIRHEKGKLYLKGLGNQVFWTIQPSQNVCYATRELINSLKKSKTNKKTNMGKSQKTMAK